MKPSAVEALALWDEGKAVPAIQVESDGSSQNDIYVVAFEFLRRHKELEDEAGAAIALDWMSSESNAEEKAVRRGLNMTQLSEREFAAAASIAVVAASKGWSVMLHEHEHPSIIAIEVQKPKPAASSA